MPQNKLSLWLEKQLGERGISQIELARALETSPTNVSRWIKGQRPDFDACIAIASFFGAEPETVLDLVGKRGLLERYNKMRAALAHTATVTQGVSAADAEVHRQLQVILDQGGQLRDGFAWQIRALYDQLSRQTAGLSHGPFAPKTTRKRPVTH